jgi:predicted RNA-binding Zn-ribbon protein involved in translation (DUF1610 family)
MTTIRTTCPRCGEVDMGPEAILLSVQRGGSEGTYRFVCPECLAAVEKRADRKIVALLVSAGVDVADPGTAVATQSQFDYEGEDEPDRWTDHPEPGPGGDAAPFTIDDVIRFHFLLRDDEFLRELTRGV